MLWLFTVLSTVAALVAVLAAAHAHVSSDRAQREGKRIGALRARVMTMDALLESLQHQQRKLSGRFYANLAKEFEVIVTPQTPAPKVCANWAEAQLEGPQSTFASCECDYCSVMRAERERVRRELVPKSQAARIAEMRRGLAQP
jgi:hypothetical protein